MSLRAGTAVADITPREAVPLFGYPRVERVSTGVHDPLLVSALHLRTGSHGILVLSLDLFALDPPTTREIRGFVAKQCHTNEENVFVCCTHTHSGPTTVRMLAWQSGSNTPEADQAYLESIKQAAARAGAQASATSAPAEVAWVSADASGLSGNRLDKAGLTDPEVGILAVRQEGGGPLMGVLNVFGAHPAVLQEDSLQVSSDFVHYTRSLLRERFGDSLVVLHCTGPCADQGPRHFLEENTFAAAEKLGCALGERIASALQAAGDENFSSDIAIAARLTPIEVTRRSLPSLWDAKVMWGERRAACDKLQQEGGAGPEADSAKRLLQGAESTLALLGADQQGAVQELLSSYCPIEVQVIRIRDTYLVGFPGELSAHYGLALKTSSERKVYGVDLATGELQGYIVAPEIEQASAYEAANSVLDAAVGGKLVETALSVVSDL